VGTARRFWSTGARRRIWPTTPRCAYVAADVSELVGRGVEFDLVEFGDFEMVDHVLTTPVGSSAWFKDPDGNTIQLVQPA
jgi:hypothetical protein